MTYAMFAGEPPFTGPTVQAIVARVMSEEPRSLTALRKSVAPYIDGAVHTALEKLPADRFATAKEYAGALVNPSSATVRLPLAASRAAWRSVAIAGWCLAALLAAAAVWQATREPAPVGGSVARFTIPLSGVHSESQAYSASSFAVAAGEVTRVPVAALHAADRGSRACGATPRGHDVDSPPARSSWM